MPSKPFVLQFNANSVTANFVLFSYLLFFSIFIYVFSQSGRGVRDKRRIWVRCPFCWTITNTPAAHLDAQIKGCRRSLHKSGLERSEVIQRMRDGAYAFTSKQTISPAVLEKISTGQRTTDATGCMMELCRHLDIKVSKSASHGRKHMSNRATKSIVDLTELSDSDDNDLYKTDDRNDDEEDDDDDLAGSSFSRTRSQSPSMKVGFFYFHNSLTRLSSFFLFLNHPFHWQVSSRGDNGLEEKSSRNNNHVAHRELLSEWLSKRSDQT